MTNPTLTDLDKFRLAAGQVEDAWNALISEWVQVLAKAVTPVEPLFDPEEYRKDQEELMQKFDEGPRWLRGW